MITFNFILGVLLIVLGVASLIYALRANKPGKAMIGGGGAGIFVMLGFAFFAMGSLLFIFGILGRYSDTGLGM